MEGVPSSAECVIGVTAGEVRGGLSQSGVKKQTVIWGQRDKGQFGRLRALCGSEFQAGVGGGRRQEVGREEGGE